MHILNVQYNANDKKVKLHNEVGVLLVVSLKPHGSDAGLCF